MIDGLQRLVVQLEGDSSLAERNQLRRRLEALDRLDAYFPDTAEAGFGAESTERELYRRARAVCARLEAANEELYEAIRCEIRRGSRPESLLRWVPAGEGTKDVGGPANGVGYDFLDELIRGVFPFEEPGAGHNARDPEKVFYQPTPARHIFRLIELTTLTARDVFVDLGSGLGHVSMLASICTDARSMGIELEAGYVECARRCAQKLNLNAVTFVQEDARVADLTSGTVFYFYTPFAGSILRRVLDRLKREATSRRIRICSYRLCTSVIAEEPWLEAATTPEACRITLFCSRD
ncbi:MAG: hypothetical protein WBF01_12695 [Candidatus Acidiferrum sp.]